MYLNYLYKSFFKQWCHHLVAQHHEDSYHLTPGLWEFCLPRIGSNGHCGTQGTAERVRRIYAMPADLPAQCATGHFPAIPKQPRLPPKGDLDVES